MDKPFLMFPVTDTVDVDEIGIKFPTKQNPFLTKLKWQKSVMEQQTMQVESSVMSEIFVELKFKKYPVTALVKIAEVDVPTLPSMEKS